MPTLIFRVSIVITCLTVISLSVRADHAPKESSSPLGDIKLPPDMTVRVGDWFTFTPGTMLQFRYTLNHRSDVPANENSITDGFTIPRFRLWFATNIADFVEMYVRAGVNDGGSFVLERAFGDIRFGDFRLRGGQFYLPIFAEADNVPAHHTLATDYSATSIVFDPGSSQGILLQYAPDRLRAKIALTNGLRTGFSDFGTNPLQADYAITGEVEAMLLSKDWQRINDFTSFRGSDNMLNIGLAMHYQSGGDTGNTGDFSLTYLAAHLHSEGDGWNFYSQFIWNRLDIGASIPWARPQNTYNDMGFTLQGGAYVLNWLEPYARYDHIIPDGAVRPVEIGGPATEQFRTITSGLNTYLIPRTHMAKFTLEFQYMFDGQIGSLVPVEETQGILATTGDQWVIRTQFVFSI